MKQSGDTFNGVFAAFAFLYVGTARTLILSLPPQQTAEAGLPATLLGLLAFAVLAVGSNYLSLVPFNRLGRSVFAKGARRSVREWIALLLVVVFFGMSIWLQASLYTQVLKSNTFPRTPRPVIGLLLALPSWLASQMRLTTVFRVSQVFMYGQALLPLFFVPVPGFSINNLGEFWRPPGSNALQMLPILVLIYSGGPVLLMLDDRSRVRLAARAIPFVTLFKLAWFVVGTVAIAGTLGADLLRITPFPGLKYLQTIRTPGIERFDLTLMFLVANVAAGSALILGKGIVLAGEVIGVPAWAGALIVGTIAVHGATRAMLPGTLQQATLMTLVAWIILNLSLLSIPRSKEK